MLDLNFTNYQRILCELRDRTFRPSATDRPPARPPAVRPHVRPSIHRSMTREKLNTFLRCCNLFIEYNVQILSRVSLRT